MDKKLKKYILRYDMIQNCLNYTIVPNGGMIVLINKEIACELLIEDKTFIIEPFQALLINAYESSINIKSNENLNLTALRFRGAGASFFYEEEMNMLMHSPKEPIILEDNILEKGVDNYLKNRLRASKLPFNIMKIIDLLDRQGSDYNIDEILGIANVPRKTLDKMFNLRTGLTFKTYASLSKNNNNSN